MVCGYDHRWDVLHLTLTNTIIPIIIACGLCNGILDLVDALLQGLLGTTTMQDDGVILGDANLFGLTQHAQVHLVQLVPQFLRDNL